MPQDAIGRDDARDVLTAAFGDPLVLRVKEGEIYRWVLKRPHGVDVYVTLDAPEMPHLAHLMVSDPRAKINPIQSIMIRTRGELDAVIAQIRKQWEET